MSYDRSNNGHPQQYATEDYGNYNPYAQDAGNPFGDDVVNGAGQTYGQSRYAQQNVQQYQAKSQPRVQYTSQRQYAQQGSGRGDYSQEQAYPEQSGGYGQQSYDQRSNGARNYSQPQQSNGYGEQPQQSRGYGQEQRQYAQQRSNEAPRSAPVRQDPRSNAYAQQNEYGRSNRYMQDNQSYTQSDGRGPEQTYQGSRGGYAQQAPSQDVARVNGYQQERPDQAYGQDTSRRYDAQPQDERRYDPRYQQRSREPPNGQYQSMTSPTSSTFGRDNQAMTSPRQAMDPRSAQRSTQSSQTSTQSGPKKLSMEEWKAQEKARMHSEANKPETIAQDNAFPTFPTKKAESTRGQSAMSMRSEDRPSTATSMRPDGRPGLTRNHSSQQDLNDSARPSMDSQPRIGSPLQRSHTPPRARKDSYGNGSTKLPPLNIAEAQNARTDGQPVSPNHVRPHTSDSRYARKPAEQPMSPLGKFAQSAQDDARGQSTRRQDRQPTSDPFSSTQRQDRKPTSDAYSSTQRQDRQPTGDPYSSTQRQDRQPTTDPNSSTRQQEQQPANAAYAQEHDPYVNARRQEQTPVNGAYSRSRASDQRPADNGYGNAQRQDQRSRHDAHVDRYEPPQQTTSREEEIEAEAAMFDTVAPSQSDLRKRRQTIDQHLAPAIQDAPPVPNFDFGFSQQNAQHQGLERPVQPYANETQERRSMDDSRSVNGRPPPQRFYGGAPRPDYERQTTVMSDPGVQRMGHTPVNPDALPAHPAPVRAGLMNGNAPASSRPPPVRNYGSPAPSQPSSRVASAETPVQSSASEAPITAAELSRLRAHVDANPASMSTSLDFAKKLVEASKVLATEGGRADPKTAAKNRERYLMEAYKRVKKLASGGYPPAQFYLADCYGQGMLGLEVDPKEAFKLYQAAAKAGHATAAYRTAVCCEIGAEEGGGTSKDLPRAVQWYRRAAALGETGAMFKVGMIALKGLLGQPRNLGEATIWLKRAAERADQENPHALHELAQLYETANSTPELRQKIIPDDAYSLSMYKQAADLGSKYAQFRLGQCYEYGQLGLPIDHRSSIAWYSKAAAQGEHQAELALSGWYLTGAPGILQQSDVEAYLWARKAAQAEPVLAKALFAMAYFLETGIGCPINLDEAKRWYSRAASYKHPRALERLEAIKRGAKGGYKAMPVNARSKLNRKDQKQDEQECVVM